MLLLTNSLLGEVQTLVLKSGFGLLLSAALTTPPPPFPGLPLKGIIAAQQKSTEAWASGLRHEAGRPLSQLVYGQWDTVCESTL